MEDDNQQEPNAPKPKKKRPKVQAHIQTVIDARRDIVASLALRGMRQSEIVKQLASPTVTRREGGELKTYPNPSYMTNPETGEPFDKSVISRDIKMLREGWRKAAQVDSEEFFADQLHELREARRTMWAKGDMHGVTNNLALEIKLTGTALPEKKEIEFGDKTLKIFTRDELEDLTDEQLAAIAKGIAGGSS